MPKTKTKPKAVTKKTKFRRVVMLGEVPARMFVAQPDVPHGGKLYFIVECSHDDQFSHVPYRAYIGIVNRRLANKFPFWRFKLSYVV